MSLVSIPLSRLPEQEEIEQWYSFTGNTSSQSFSRAAIRVSLKYTPSSSSPSFIDSNMMSIVSLSSASPPPVPSFASDSPATQAVITSTTASSSSSSSLPTTSLRGMPTPPVKEQTTTTKGHLLPTGIIDYLVVVGASESDIDLDSKHSNSNLTASTTQKTTRKKTTAPTVDAAQHVPEGDHSHNNHRKIDLNVNVAVQRRYPPEDKPDFPLPTKIEWFCFPGGYEVIQCSDSKPPLPKLFTFVLSGGPDGTSRAYGICLILYVSSSSSSSSVSSQQATTTHDKTVPHHQFQTRQSMQERSPPSRTAPPTTRTRSTDQGSAVNVVSWLPTCICLLTRLPLLSPLQAILLQLSRLYLEDEHTLAEYYIAELTTYLSLPIRNRVNVAFLIAGLPITLSWSDHNKCADHHYAQKERHRILSKITHDVDVISLSAPFPPLLYPLAPLFQAFSIQTIIQLVVLALCEYKLVIHSHHLSLLCPIAESLTGLMYPFQWQHPYVPLLPRILSEYLQAPLPYILGVHTTWLPSLLSVFDGARGHDTSAPSSTTIRMHETMDNTNNLPSSPRPDHCLVLVDIDRGTVQCTSTNFPPPPPPPHHHHHHVPAVIIIIFVPELNPMTDKSHHVIIEPVRQL